MIRTVRGWINPILWGVLGWMFAIFANAMTVRLIEVFGDYALHGQMRHVDEVFMGLTFAFMRWFHGEWQLGQIYQSREMEVEIRNALQVLYHSANEEHRRKAVSNIVEAFEHHRPVHPEFRVSVDELLKRLRLARSKEPPRQ